MNRRTDEANEDFSHLRQEVCLKEKEWREVHDFIAGTDSYRKSLNEKIGGVTNGLWAVALVVLIPFTTGLIWIGGIGQKVYQHAVDITEIKQDVKDIRKELGHGKL